MRAMYEIFTEFSSPTVFLKTFATSTRIRSRRKDRIHDLFDIGYSMSTRNDGFECYSRGGFAKFESLERGMREAILCGKVSRQNVNPTRGQGFTLHPDLYLPTSDTFDPQRKIPLSRDSLHLPSNFLPLFHLENFHFRVKIKMIDSKRCVSNKKRCTAVFLDV